MLSNFMRLISLSSSSGRALAILTSAWGLWVANPYIDTFSRGTGFAAMGQIAPEWAWGLLMIFMGLRALFYMYRNSHKNASNAFFGITLMWGFMGITLLMSNYYVTGWMIYLYIATRAVRLFLYYNTDYRGLIRHAEYTAV